VTEIIKILFLAAVGLIFFSYFGYPLSIYFISLIWEKRVKKAAISPNVTLIITAYNEENRIKQKLENTLNLEYPKIKLHVIVVSDGSTDRTNAIVKDYEKNGFELLAITERRGKENAQKEAVNRAKGEVLVFTDVATQLSPEGLKEIVSNFADPSVGCVSSEDKLIGKDGKPSGEGFYVRYEMWLRRLESRVNSLVGLSGSFFAARKAVCEDFSGELQSDFRTVLNSMKLGLRGVSDPRAIGYYLDISDEKLEFDRKVRTVVRGLTVFFRHLEFLNVFRHGLFSYQYLCHKLFRWLVPVFLCIAFISNLILAARSSPFFILLLGQLIFYGLAMWGWKTKSKDTLSSRSFLKIPMFFLTVNASAFVAWLRYLKGQRVVMWTPSER
jgi:cellulose synthase/poly-beta-1,6-N-acetylglucosamine synthase-like glycosyltransferase